MIFEHYSKEKISERENSFRLNVKNKEENPKKFDSDDNTKKNEKKSKRINSLFAPKKNLIGNTQKFLFGICDFSSYHLKKLWRCKKSKKQLLFEKSEEIFMKEVDIINILKKIHEKDKMKIILFEENQLILFNSLSKPLISLGGSVSKNKMKELDSPENENGKIDEENSS